MDLLNWQSVVDDFKAKARQFMDAMNWLSSNGAAFNATPELKAEREKLLSRGSIIKSTIEMTTKAIDEANKLLTSFKNLFGMNGTRPGQLGALPIVLPLAVVTAAVAAIVYWMNDFNRLRSKMYTDMVEAGIDPKKATETITSVPSGGSTSILPTIAGASNFLPYAAVVVGLWMLFK